MDELSEEGMRLWEKLGDTDFLNNPTKNRWNKRNSEVKDRLRSILETLVENSRMVVDQCLVDIKEMTKQEKYFAANQSKVAHLCHSNFIERLQRILDDKEPFEFILSESSPPEDKFYVK